MDTHIALITGANKGIGYETARLLGRRGMTVLVGARSTELGERAARELTDGGMDARFVQLDVTDPESVAKAAALVESEYGRLDVLVNNAGIARGDGTGRPSETRLETLREIFETKSSASSRSPTPSCRCCCAHRPPGSSTSPARSARSPR